MCSRLSLVGALVVLAAVCAPGSSRAQESAGGRLSFGLEAARVDFAKEIRFEDGNSIGARVMARVRPWWQLGMQFDRISARDRELDRWQNILVASIQSRFHMRPQGEWSPVLGAGVSFMGFEDSDRFDAVAEGLDLTLGFERKLGEGWNLHGEFLSRMQTFNVVIVDVLGRPTGEGEQTGYRWSRVMQLGLEHAF